MKWAEIDPKIFDKASARQLGKTRIHLSLLFGYLDWLERGSPPEEEVNIGGFEKVKID